MLLEFQDNLPFEFWVDYVLHAVYWINRVPTPLLLNKSPFSILVRVYPDLSNLRILEAFVLHQQRKQTGKNLVKG